MKKLLFVLFSCFLVSCTQTVTRWASKNNDFENMHLSMKYGKNIFEEYLWSMPDFIPIKVTDNLITFNESNYLIKHVNEDSINLVLNDEILCSSRKQLSDSTIYFDKSALSLKSVAIKRWVPVTTYETKSVPVTYSEPQMNYRTDYSYSGNLGATSRTFTYISYNIKTRYELRTVPVTNWQYQLTTDYQSIIPEYEFFHCKIDDSDILLYQVKDESNNSYTYYFQNPSYIIASDSGDTRYILIDRNSNGRYNDLDDLFMVTAWNPYEEESSFRDVRFILQNKWHENSYLLEELFLELNYDEERINITSPNSNYSHDSTGTLILENLPTGAKLLINGKYYRTEEGSAKLKNQFGKFKLTVERKGYLDFQKVYEITNSSDKVIIKVEKTSKSGLLKLSNIFSDNYFVTVKNKQLEPKTWHNPKSINIPIGENEITIQTSGFNFIKELNIEQGKEYEIDFEAELKKLVTNIE